MQLKGRPLYYYRLHTGQQISNVEPEAVKRRNLLQGYKILFLGHRAFLQKQRYLQLTNTDSKDSQEILVDTIMRLREIVVYAGKVVVGWAWKDAMKRFKEKDIFFLRKPKDYTFSLLSFLKNTPIKERFRLSTVCLYYSFTYPGAKMYYWLTSLRRGLETQRINKLAKAEKEENYRRKQEKWRIKNLAKAAKKESRRRAQEIRRNEKLAKAAEKEN